MRVRSLLFSLGYRYRLHRKDLPGKPDIVLPKYRTAIFVHGCFWHSHECKLGQVEPKTHSEFWEEKRRGTKERDTRNVQALEIAGWHVLAIWECQLKPQDELRALVTSALPPARA